MNMSRRENKPWPTVYINMSQRENKQWLTVQQIVALQEQQLQAVMFQKEFARRPLQKVQTVILQKQIWIYE